MEGQGPKCHIDTWKVKVPKISVKLLVGMTGYLIPTHFPSVGKFLKCHKYLLTCLTNHNSINIISYFSPIKYELLWVGAQNDFLAWIAVTSICAIVFFRQSAKFYMKDLQENMCENLVPILHI